MLMYDILVFIFLLIISFFAIIQDLKFRKVSNKLNYIFLGLSFIIFLVLNYLNYNLTNVIFIFISFLFVFLLYYLKIIGAGDGKFFIGVMLLLIGTFSYLIFFDYLLNLFLIYSFGIIFLILFKTDFKHKIAVIKSLKYYTLAFQSFFIVFIGAIFFRYLNLDENFINIIIVYIYFLTLIISFSIILKKYFEKLDENSKILFNFILFCGGFYFLLIDFFLYFIFLFSLRVFITFVGDIVESIKSNLEDRYSSPFVVYLSLAGIITYVLGSNIVVILVQVFL